MDDKNSANNKGNFQNIRKRGGLVYMVDGGPGKRTSEILDKLLKEEVSIAKGKPKQTSGKASKALEDGEHGKLGDPGKRTSEILDKLLKEGVSGAKNRPKGRLLNGGRTR